MSNPQAGAWQTARPRHLQSGSRTPQNRSSTASPTQQNPPTQPPKQDAARSHQQSSNAWSQKAAGAGDGNRPVRAEVSPQSDRPHQSLNGFNAAEVKAFLKRDASSTPYKPETSSGSRNNAAWGSRPNQMANNQSFFGQLAKQITTIEGGG